MKKGFLLSFAFLCLCFFYLTNITKISQRSIAGIKTLTNETTVSLSIGEFHFTLFGYTSPQAKVTFSGLGIFDETYADETGYFIFNNRFSPFSPREACLTAQDVLGRLSSPLCLPPFPTIYNVEIGPVVMPPTVSVDNGEYFIGDEAMLSGQTMPNAEVDLAFFTGSGRTNVILSDSEESSESVILRPDVTSGLDPSPAERGQDDKRRKFSLIPSVNAFSFPELKAKSDEKGNFAISIPTSNPTTLRTFARASFANSLSPKSLMLNIKVLPWWMIILKIFGLVFQAIKNHWLEVGLLAEFVILASILINHFFHPHRLAKARAIVLREKYAISQLKDCLY